MTAEIIIVLVILLGAIILFVTEKIPVDVVAIIIMMALIVSGIISPEKGFLGFSNQATITVAAMFVLSSGLYRTGAMNLVGKKLSSLFRYNFYAGLITMMIFVGIFSAFVNNTPVVAIFIPILIHAAQVSKHSVSKMLMPLSFAAMFGGVCTMIGTSTNILVSGIAANTPGGSFSMFEMLPLGLVFFVSGLLYMILIGNRLLPDHKVETDLTEKFNMAEYLTEVILLPHARSVGQPVASCALVKDLDVYIIQVTRGTERFFMPPPDMILQPDDVLRVRCKVDEIDKLQNRQGILIKSGAKHAENALSSKDIKLIEAVVAPNSELEGKTIKEVGFKYRYGATALAIRHRDEVVNEKLSTIRLRSGDTLLLEIKKDRIPFLKQRLLEEGNTFLFISEVAIPEYRKTKIIPSLLIITAVVVSAALDILPIMTASVIGCVLMVLTKCINTSEAYQAIEWRVIFLLAGTLSLGVALMETGAAKLLSDDLLILFGQYGPVAMVSVFYLLTSLLTETMSNNATAALIAPLAIVTADTMGVDARPFLMAVTFAASASFMTPVGYQTNTMIYSAGNYKFKDFLRVGTPLNIMFWILATILIPKFFPFYP
jgi:di/tricarboxylate transporter